MLVIGFSIQAFAQSRTVSGTVTGPDGPEVGVYVFQKGSTSNATMTDESGKYMISVSSPDAILVFSMVGYKEVEQVVENRTIINVTMKEDQTFLEDAVVIGYGTTKKEMLVGSVSQVNSKELMKAPASNVSNLIAGKLSGVTATQTVGTPGSDGASLLVRGFGTFNSNSPLILIDGVEGLMNNVNPNDVASISVLKDAATASIYGVRAANGVILVTTKSGGEGETKISYDGSATFTNNTAIPELCNAEQYIYYHNLAMTLDGNKPLWTEENLNFMKQNGLYAETDWQKEIYNNFGFQHQHNISATGGSKKVKHYTSIGLFDQEGILKNTDYQRFNIRSNIDAQVADGLKFTLNIAANTSEQNLPGYSISPVAEFSPITAAYYALPILPTEYNGLPLAYNHGTYYRQPTSSLTDSGYNRTRHWGLDTQAKLEYDFMGIAALKGLKVSVFGGYNFDFTQNLNFMHAYDLYMFTSSAWLYEKKVDQVISQKVSQGISENSFSKSASFGYGYTFRPQIDYTRSFGKHEISALLLYEYSKSFSDTMTAYAKGIYAEDPVDITFGSDRTGTAPTGSHTWQPSLESVASRIDYSYDGKYLVGLTMRADGSSKFAPGHRWGFFPSVAAGWIMSKEDFLSSLSGTVDFLKLKASYGVLGSDDTARDLYMSLYGITSNTVLIGGQPQTTYYSRGYVHPDLTWSHTNIWNVGIESKFFGNKLSIDADVFYKYTDKILEYAGTGTFAPSLGENFATWINSGRMDNRGFELTIRHDNWFSNGFSYNITGMVSWARNKLLSKRLSDDCPSYRARLGQPLNSFYGFHSMGLFQSDEEAALWPTAPTGYNQAGSIKYEDINGDGKIDSSADMVKIGRGQTPEMTFSFNTELNYKGWSLSMLFQGATLCNYMLSGYYNGTCDNTMFTRAFYGDGNSVLYLVKDAWRPDNPNAKYPRLSTIVNASNAWASDFWIVDGSFLRLKNAQLSYTLPTSFLRSFSSISRCMVYIAGTNLFTLSAFKYLDPENPGISNGYYPIQRTVSLGLNLTF